MHGNPSKPHTEQAARAGDGGNSIAGIRLKPYTGVCAVSFPSACFYRPVVSQMEQIARDSSAAELLAIPSCGGETAGFLHLRGEFATCIKAVSARICVTASPSGGIQGSVSFYLQCQVSVDTDTVVTG